jgi:hypothetical protein
VSESANFIKKTIALMNYYSFDLGEYTTKELIIKWSKKYPHFWLPLGVTEAIYQGRCKAISVEQILIIWNRHGIPHYHFGMDFEALISKNVFNNLEEEIVLEEMENIKKEKLNKPKSPIKKNYHNSSNSSAIIVYKSPIKEFEPLEDYSHCYFQLKSLARKNFHNYQ